MSYMEYKSTFITCFFLFLFFNLPHFSIGVPQYEALDSEIYEIDYKGPETHSSVPPPDHSHGLMGSNVVKEDKVSEWDKDLLSQILSQSMYQTNNNMTRRSKKLNIHIFFIFYSF
ncbi:unnamed protein product [Lupinus luteus]|uniref:Uncharacterized protein n=1 Tax=Lupinus luteus TaxID=3873 RepID=A0AAV1WM43_LUPLU